MREPFPLAWSSVTRYEVGVMKRIMFAAAAIGTGVVVYQQVVRPWWRSWGIDSHDVTRALAGDDLVPDAPVIDTRSIEIAAEPRDVWPWLLQMGYGKAGWYSYDTIDMVGASSRRLIPEWQSLEVGAVVPTHPGGGFVVRGLEPERSLVLYSDTGIVTSQAAAAREAATDSPTTNVQTAGAFLGATQPTEFAASWAFVLEPLAGGRTRLVERFRVKFGETDKPWTAATLPVVGFGVFLMTRQQMLGIRERAERLARERVRGAGAVAQPELAVLSASASTESVPAPAG
jgi:hypothetical protein